MEYLISLAILGYLNNAPIITPLAPSAVVVKSIPKPRNCLLQPINNEQGYAIAFSIVCEE